MFKNRLLLLAQRLEKIAAKPAETRTRLFSLQNWVKKDSCGTSACAVGEATFIKSFQQLGLKYSFRDANLHFGHRTGWGAVQSFFRISLDQARHLFDMYEYPSGGDPADVAARIRKFVGTDGAI